MTANRIGIDFSQDFFDLVLANPEGRLISPTQRFNHDWPGSQQALRYVLEVCRQHPADAVWIGGEATGLLWWHLFQSWAVDPQLAALSPRFYLFNPNWIKQFRKSTPNPDKTDSRDARLITRYLGTPDQECVPWTPDGAHWPLRFLTRHRFRLAHHLTALKLQAISLLTIYASAYALVEPFTDLFGATSRKVLEQFPSLESLVQLPLEELAHRVDQWGRGQFADPLLTAHKLQEAARRSYPLTEPLAAHLHFILTSLLELVKAQETQLGRCDRFLKEHYAQDPDIQHLDGIGGIGPVFAAGLVAELRPVARFFEGQRYNPRTGQYTPRSYPEAQAAVGKLAGLCWPRSDSGDFISEERHIPRGANRYLRYYLVEAANHVREQVAEYGQYYQGKFQETRKYRHQRALILTARKLARLVFALLHKHEAYQPRRVMTR